MRNVIFPSILAFFALGIPTPSLYPVFTVESMKVLKKKRGGGGRGGADGGGGREEEEGEGRREEEAWEKLPSLPNDWL